MKAGSVVLTPLPQADGRLKNRPALVLGPVAPFDDVLVCGISTQLHLAVPDFDEVIGEGDADFGSSGLDARSLIRLGYISTVPLSSVKGRIGRISAVRHARLVRQLSDFIARFAMA
jgi:mRNA interferase MazF